MLKEVIFILCSSFVVFAESSKPSNTASQNGGIPGPGPSSERVAYEVLDGTEELGKVFYQMEKEMKLQRGVGHSAAIAILTICPDLGDANDRVKAFKEMDQALKKSGPEIYRNGAPVLRRDNQGRIFQVATERSITVDPVMSQIVSTLACKKEKRTADEMAKIAASAYADSIERKVIHPDTKEKLSWNKDLHTLLMVSLLLK